MDAETKQVQWFSFDLYEAAEGDFLQKAALRNGSEFGKSWVAVRPEGQLVLGEVGGGY